MSHLALAAVVGRFVFASAVEADFDALRLDELDHDHALAQSLMQHTPVKYKQRNISKRVIKLSVEKFSSLQKAQMFTSWG
jgi:hypothetical protein